MPKLFDCHCDTLTTAMRGGMGIIDNTLHNDIKRLSLYAAAAQFFAVWADDCYIQNAFDYTNSAIDFYYSQLSTCDFAAPVTRGCDIAQDRVNAFLAVEGAEAVEGSAEKLHMLYSRGVRLMTLCWNRTNAVGCGALSGNDGGLTLFGKEIVRQMNTIGMLIDVSHLNEAGFYDVCRYSQKPFLASHSNTYKYCKNPRNLKDDQIRQLSVMGGVIGLNLYPPFINDSGRACAADILRHTDHLLNIAGENAVVLGCDFDGIDTAPDDIQNVSDLLRLYDIMSAEFGKNTADNIFYDNMYAFVCDNLY